MTDRPIDFELDHTAQLHFDETDIDGEPMLRLEGIRLGGVTIDRDAALAAFGDVAITALELRHSEAEFAEVWAQLDARYAAEDRAVYRKSVL